MSDAKASAIAFQIGLRVMVAFRHQKFTGRWRDFTIELV
jgi:hypothetical protein